MRTYAKMSSGPEPVRQHGSAGRHAKASGRLSRAPFPTIARRGGIAQ